MVIYKQSLDIRTDSIRLVAYKTWSVGIVLIANVGVGVELGVIMWVDGGAMMRL